MLMLIFLFKGIIIPKPTQVPLSQKKPPNLP